MKLEINLNEDMFSCWRCHYSGKVLKILREHGTASQKRKYADLCGLKLSAFEDKGKEEPLVLPPEFQFVFDSESDQAFDAKEWLRELNIKRNVVYQNRICVATRGEYRNRIIFPSFDELGDLNYFVTRHLYEQNEYKWLKCRRSSKKFIFNELFIDWKKPIVLVETTKVYLKYFDEIENMVVCNGSYLSKDYELFKKIVIEDCPKVFVAFDEDAKDEAFQTLKNLDEFGVNSFYVEVSGQTDELSVDDFEDSISNAKAFEMHALLKNKIGNLV